ncbi:MAG TPA: anti-sigma factor [Acidothermaceae bacterium]|jgi:anti-sigma factor RsiW|nr:anti-sigma factor [Acidothermaceae bacterium]
MSDDNRDAATDETTLACIQVVELVTAYLEGDLDPHTRHRLDEHLAVCPPCQVYLEQMRQTIDEVGSVPVENLPEETRADLLDAFRAFHSTDNPSSD